MNKEKIITATIAFVKKELKNAEGGHDWFHIARVFKNSLLISKDEKVAIFVVSLAALLHDIADPKFYNGDETVGPKVATTFLKEMCCIMFTTCLIISLLTFWFVRNLEATLGPTVSSPL